MPGDRSRSVAKAPPCWVWREPASPVIAHPFERPEEAMSCAPRMSKEMRQVRRLDGARRGASSVGDSFHVRTRNDGAGTVIPEFDHQDSNLRLALEDA